MERSKLLVILRSFDNAEVSRWQKFCQSSYFNTNAQLSGLAEILGRLHPVFDPGLVKAEHVHNELFGQGEKYDALRMRRLVSRLLELTEKFIAVEAFQERPATMYHHLLCRLNEKKLNSFMELKVKEKESWLGQQKETLLSYHLNNFLVEEEIISNQFQKYHGRHEKINKSDYILKSLGLLTRYYLLYFFDSYEYLQEEEKIFNRKPGFTLPERALLELQELFGIEDDIFSMCYLLIKLEQTEDKTYYYRLKEMLLCMNEGALPGYDQKNFFIRLTNFCFRRTRHGDLSFFNELVSLYNEIFSRELHLEYGQLSHILFQNVVSCRLAMNDVAFVKQFINKYKDLLPPDHRESTVNISLSELYLHERRYTEALKLIALSHPITSQKKIVLKGLEIKVHYEMNNEENAFYTMDTLRHQFKELKNLSAASVLASRNFIRLTKKLFRLRNKRITKKQEEELIREVISCNELSNRYWLVAKVKELRPRRVDD